MMIIKRTQTIVQGTILIALEYALITALLAVGAIGAVSVTDSRDRSALSSASERGTTLNTGIAENNVAWPFSARPES